MDDGLTPEQREIIATLMNFVQEVTTLMKGIQHYLAKATTETGNEAYTAGFKAGVAGVALNLVNIMKTLPNSDDNTTLH